MSPVFLEFSGWVQLNPNTTMKYIGQDDNQKPFITVQELDSLPTHIRNLYILEDTLDAIVKADDLKFTEQDIVNNPLS